jgi:hypothetical protein
MGKEGDQSRKMLVLTNHAILDGGGVTLWLTQLLEPMNVMLTKVRASSRPICTSSTHLLD